ncbi:MAG: cadmium-translocating P-type ATPase, partial [Chloroflexi bacterium]|nr:cadmium-translocating P-type ATPase [Chloroflexota bacterium]
AAATLSFATAVLTVTPAPGEAARLAAHQAVTRLGQQMGHPVTLRGELYPVPVAEPALELAYDVGELDCADCAAHFEGAVRGLAGAAEATLNFATAVLTVTPRAAEEREALHRAVTEVGQQMGHPVTLRGERTPNAAPQAEGAPSWWGRLLARRRDLTTAGAGLAIVLALALRLLGAPEAASTALYALAILVGGYYVAKSGWFGFRATRSLDMNALMTLAAVGAMILGEWVEGAMVIFLFSLGNTLESYTVNRARHAIRALMSLAPKVAYKLVGEAQVQVPVEALAVGDRIQVRPSDRIPMDGDIESGHSAVNQAPVTGESLPVEKGIGDAVYAGTINGEGSLTVRVTRLAQDNTIARIIRMVEEAQASKAPSQRFVDRFARVYTPLVIAGALLVAVLPPLSGLGGWAEWFYRALVLLVISCPCALVISTPVSIVSAISAAARMGVLVKGGAYLEELGAVRAVAFDKTGTLTRGEPIVVGGGCDQHNDVDVLPDRCLAYQGLLTQAAAVERHSPHPLAKAVVAEAERLGLGDGPAAEDVQSEPGRGIRGTVGGHQVVVGSHAYVHANGEGDHCEGDFCQRVEAAAGNGQTTMVVADLCCGRRGLIAVADRLRPTAAQAVSDLRAAGIADVVMLTGDNPATAAAIAKQAGIEQVRAGLSPADKVEAVRGLLSEYGRVAMVGDGVNDAPALAQASVGIAMGAIGTDAALETADVALMSDDLAKLAPTIRLGRRTLATIRQNILVSLAIKALFLALAVAGAATLWMAVFADVGTSMLVILNSMRLLRRAG